jgi:LPS sulfotransferase NodH
VNVTPSGGWSAWNPIAPTRSCLICSTPRSGSTYLCDLLAGTHLAGYPAEHFSFAQRHQWLEQWGIVNLDDYLPTALQEATSSNGIFSTKIMYTYLDRLVGDLRARFDLGDRTIPEILSYAFPNPVYVWISRQDKVRQAVSLHRAMQTGMWIKRPNIPDSPDRLYFDYQHIDVWVRQMIEQDQAWDEFFRSHAIQPVRIIYEELAAAPQETVLTVLRELGVTDSVEFSGSRLQRQADEISDRWVERYYKLKESLEKEVAPRQPAG